ncbi:hypothetical protein HDA32_003190 [Spinactinospora alkalitolerans]|uniref:Uncharacterized protein n=1 Tax=Spinactinospora alkalitolerans TaxID=687207 RepID=A0A852U264_9ACTN|nr:hypothetical protein [Spinactinospora alkalitolerans]NYE48070.1 hypothetical protein [Spinactinospora alkalitolerans]
MTSSVPGFEPLLANPEATGTLQKKTDTVTVGDGEQQACVEITSRTITVHLPDVYPATYGGRLDEIDAALSALVDASDQIRPQPLAERWPVGLRVSTPDGSGKVVEATVSRQSRLPTVWVGLDGRIGSPRGFSPEKLTPLLGEEAR